MSDKKTTVKISAKLSFPLFGYVMKRIFIFLPTLFAISLITFILISLAPGDPAEAMLNRSSGEGQASDKLAGDQAYQEIRHRLGLDLPVFYFAPASLADCDTLNRIPQKDQRETLERLIYQYGNWDKVAVYHAKLKALERTILFTPKDSVTTSALIDLRNEVNNLYLQQDEASIKNVLAKLKVNAELPALSAVKSGISEAETAFDEVKNNATTWKRFVPIVQWYGTENQYHRWLFGTAKWFGEEEDPTKVKGFLRGDFGVSFFAKRPVASIIWDGLWITMLISVLVILIEYLIAIPLGVATARKKDSKFDSISTTVLFILYSLPSFWIGTLAIFFLCGGDYFDFFPPFGLGDTSVEYDGFFVRAGDLLYHLALPLIVASYGGLAFLSRQMRGGMLAVLRQDYIRTAYSKGLDPSKVIWKHAFRNSLLPIITIFANVFPALIGGSIILEFLFTIPGLGQATYMAVIQKDYPMILTTTMFAAILTLIGYLIADILYAVVDPRISYSKK